MEEVIKKFETMISNSLSLIGYKSQKSNELTCGIFSRYEGIYRHYKSKNNNNISIIITDYSCVAVFTNKGKTIQIINASSLEEELIRNLSKLQIELFKEL